MVARGGCCSAAAGNNEVFEFPRTGAAVLEVGWPDVMEWAEAVDAEETRAVEAMEAEEMEAEVAAAAAATAAAEALEAAEATRRQRSCFSSGSRELMVQSMSPKKPSITAEVAFEKGFRCSGGCRCGCGGSL